MVQLPSQRTAELQGMYVFAVADAFAVGIDGQAAVPGGIREPVAGGVASALSYFAEEGGG